MPVPCFEGVAEKLSQTGVSSTGLLEPLQPGRGTPEQNRVDSGHGGGGWLWTDTPRTHAPPLSGLVLLSPRPRGGLVPWLSTDTGPPTQCCHVPPRACSIP